MPWPAKGGQTAEVGGVGTGGGQDGFAGLARVREDMKYLQPGVRPVGNAMCGFDSLSHRHGKRDASVQPWQRAQFGQTGIKPPAVVQRGQMLERVLRIGLAALHG